MCSSWKFLSPSVCCDESPINQQREKGKKKDDVPEWDLNPKQRQYKALVSGSGSFMNVYIISVLTYRLYSLHGGVKWRCGRKPKAADTNLVLLTCVDLLKKYMGLCILI